MVVPIIRMDQHCWNFDSRKAGFGIKAFIPRVVIPHGTKCRVVMRQALKIDIYARRQEKDLKGLARMLVNIIDRIVNDTLLQATKERKVLLFWT